MALSFRIGRIPVKILPSFFLVTVVLNVGTSNLTELISWALVVLASVLAHELGHAALAGALGLAPRIELHAMGGTTAWSTPRVLPVPQRIAISLAGPLAGFAVAALVKWGLPRSLFEGVVGANVYADLLFVNFGWGVLNLLPMLPLDGGNVMAEILNVFTGGRGARPARVVSIVVAVCACLLAFRIGAMWPALLAVSFAASNWQGLTALRAAEFDAPMRKALEEAYVALDAKNAARVLELARPVALKARSAPVRAEALQLLAFGFLLEGRLADADAAIAAMPQGFAAHASLVNLRTQVAASRSAAS